MISQFDILARLGTAALLGGLVGLERERLMWAAGVRTHMLVAVGACLFMIVSAYGFEHARTLDHVILDPSRIAAQVVSGIGFLGAGSILLRTGHPGPDHRREHPPQHADAPRDYRAAGREDQIKLRLVRVSRTAVDTAIAVLKTHPDVRDVILLWRESYTNT